MTYHDTSGNSYSVNQVISFNALLPAQDGFIYDATQLIHNNSGLTIPFRLADSYSNISILIDNQPAEFSCYKNTYNINTLCSINIKSNNITTNLNANNLVKIIGYDSTGAIKNTAILVLINTQAANIITSGVNVVINPDDGTRPQTLYLVNNGLVSATGLTISPTNPVTVTSNTCGTTLLANANCSFVINVTGSPSSGQSYVAVSYSNGQSNQVLYFNVSYANKTGPNLILTQSGNFTNIASGTGPIFMSVNVSNSGITNLSSLQFNNLNLQKSNMSSYVAGSTCYNGINLNTGVSCTMILSYSPNAAESGTVTFIPIASYTESGGQTITYANSILNIPYSAVTIPIFTTISDSGYVITSSNNPPTTWAGVNVPSINGQTPNNMASNGNSWSTVTSGTTNKLYCVAYNGVFVVTAANRTILWSTDGQTWTAAATITGGAPTTSNLFTVTSNL